MYSVYYTEGSDSQKQKDTNRAPSFSYSKII